ncbi:MAG: hypothetical protein IT440_12455 [Phycisphaeraceae bacterium]|nr:hypothetical protein [Phycisphaeraceae bacterium]
MMKSLRCVLGLAVLIWLTACASPEAAPQSSLSAFARRLPGMESQLPRITASAEAAARRVAEKPQTNLIYPASMDMVGFASEFLGRAGGLAATITRVSAQQPAGDGDIVVLGIRNWRLDEPWLMPMLLDYRGRGCTVIVFGPRSQMPRDLPCDAIIDNGASAGELGDGPTNLAANVALGWMWTCEYAAALSRLGKAPGILWSVAMNDSREHNQPLQTPEGRHKLEPTDQAVAAGVLGKAYLQRVRRLVRELGDTQVQSVLNHAAEMIADHLRQGHAAYLSGLGHLTSYELAMEDGKTPWKPVAISSLLPAISNMDRRDFLVWIGYVGLAGLPVETMSHLQQQGVDMVLSEAPMPSRRNMPDDLLSRVNVTGLRTLPQSSPVLATIPQQWLPPDAEIAVPWSPGRMAPISGLNAVLLFRMLDDEVARRLPPR